MGLGIQRRVFNYLGNLDIHIITEYFYVDL